MLTENLSERFNQCAKCLNAGLYDRVIKLPDKLKEQAQEIRLRVNRPVAICCGKQTYYATENFQFVTAPIFDNMLLATKRDIAESFQNICCYSVYSRQNEIKNGFVTMAGGHRAGICGTAVYDSGGSIINIRDISSVNIRIARQINGAANKMLSLLGEKIFDGVLLCGVPAAGKTTLLRDAARQLSMNTDAKVAVIDERGELGGTYCGMLQNDLGYSDVLDGYCKGDGIMQALRAMSPSVVICDEVGTCADAVAIEEALNAGVAVIAAIHGEKSSFLRRPQAQRLKNTGAFNSLVFLKSGNTPGQIDTVCTWEDLKNVTACRSIYDSNKHDLSGDNVV